MKEGGNYTTSYTYHLAGGLKSITEPFNHTVTYSTDKIGRMTSIAGSGTGVSVVYASNILHRAFGALKEMTMGTTADTTISIGYNNALRPEIYWADNTTTGTGYVQKAGYTYHSDGTVDQIDNQRSGGLDQQFDQRNRYDFAGRLKKNDVGPINALGNGTSFSQTMTYDAFNNLTSRSNVTQGYPDDFSTTYTNNRKNSVPSSRYDAVGNEVTVVSPMSTSQYGVPYTSVMNWNFDAAGRLAHWDEDGPWANTHTADISFDGDGRAVKKRSIDNEGLINWYYIYSSVTGQKITSMLDEGAYDGTSVYMGKTVIHDTGLYEGTILQANGLRVTDPISGSTQEILPDGTVPHPSPYPYSRNELAGLGTSVPTETLESYPLPEYGQGGNPGSAASGCLGYVDNVPTSCAKAIRSLIRENGKLLSDPRDLPIGFSVVAKFNPNSGRKPPDHKPDPDKIQVFTDEDDGKWEYWIVGGGSSLNFDDTSDVKNAIKGAREFLKRDSMCRNFLDKILLNVQTTDGDYWAPRGGDPKQDPYQRLYFAQINSDELLDLVSKANVVSTGNSGRKGGYLNEMNASPGILEVNKSFGSLNPRERQQRVIHEGFHQLKGVDDFQIYRAAQLAQGTSEGKLETVTKPLEGLTRSETASLRFNQIVAGYCPIFPRDSPGTNTIRIGR
ncbi:MAG: hypothetical protein ACKVRN_02725 [Pyrinomonadaceae bacterium]